MALGEFLTRWTVRSALLLYVVGLALRANASGSRARLVWARRAWTAGCCAFLLHVACAFQFYYHWSHTIAYAATARRTEEVVGLEWGGGLFANYAFTLLWTADTCWWWYGLCRYQARPRGVEWVVQGFLGFMVFNAVVPFGVGAVRWVGLGVCLFLAGMWGCQVLRAKGDSR